MSKIRLFFKKGSKLKQSGNTPECPPNTAYNPVTKECEPITPECPPNTAYNPVTKECEPITPECPPNTVYNPVTKECEPIENGECTSNHTKDLFTGECIEIPEPPNISDIPTDAYYMVPNSKGDFTQEMFNDVISRGHRYIVLDTRVWNVIYGYYPEKRTHRKWDKISFYDRFDEDNPLTIDARKCFINCYHNREDIMEKHYVFSPDGASNIRFRFGYVEGDKYKRAFDKGTDERKHESTALVSAVHGSRNIIVEGEFISGFMADAVTGMSQTAERLNFNGRHYKIDGENNKFQSPWYPLTEENNVKYGNLSFSTGNGYYRIPHFDLFDFTTIFLDKNDKEIQRLEGCEFLKDIPVPKNARKVSTIVKDLTGTRLNSKEEYREYGNPFGYSVSHNLHIKNTTITDNHRGGLSNLGPYTVVDNCTFYNTQRYWDSERFPYTTRYEICLEDAISKNAIIKNCNIEGKFHSILLASNVSIKIHGNNIKGSYSIALGSLIEGEIYDNILEGDGENNNRIVGASSNNYGAVEVYNNTGSAVISLSYGSIFRNNKFNKGSIVNNGFAYDNIFTNFNMSRIPYTKDFHDNTFIGMDESLTPYVYEGVDVFRNTFKNCWFNFHHGDYESEYRIFDLCDFEGQVYKSNGELQHSFVKSYSNTINIFKNCRFKNQTFHHRSVNSTNDVRQGDWYFEDCDFSEMEGLFFESYTNGDQPTVNPKLVFKNCTFEGKGTFINKGIRTIKFDIVFYNCEIDPRIILPDNYTTSSVNIPQRNKELSTRPKLIMNMNSRVIEKKGTLIIDGIDGVIDITVPYRRTEMLVRNKKTLHKEVIIVSKFYHYYLEGQDVNDMEFSIDGGRTWESDITIYPGGANINDGITVII